MKKMFYVVSVLFLVVALSVVGVVAAKSQKVASAAKAEAASIGDSLKVAPVESSAASVVECIQYDPESLQITDLGASGWVLTDSSEKLTLQLDNEADAQQALELAKQFTQMCFIGNQGSWFVMQYWEGDSTLSTSMTDADCLSYNPNNVETAFSDDLWRIIETVDGQSHSMFAFETQFEADAALKIVKSHTQSCFIGRDNQRENRQNYIVEYLK